MGEDLHDLVADAIGWESPICDDEYATQLMVCLRELRYVFQRLAEGDALPQALRTPDDAEHFRTLLSSSQRADMWIASLLDEKP